MTVEFRNVTFIYPSTERKIFDNLSFTFGGKKFVAVVGENGAGKTTFFKLLMRLYDPNEGEILIADYILYLKNGQVIESGTHRHLIEQGGKYATMYNTQKNRFI